ncbi:lymphocyte antigen 6 complex locus protein G6f isoform X1 [Lagenorhynchus albirostris]|uniref:lymphocyte antigen 6 complex locus protein G6f isoform X1 n=1 Tax=Lagenorhynchus albirostris TaxID=27610 RepID=UPI0028E89D6C|nr:lymphocyte antigen 6 complex locus protein G6f isoform X1 [Lagenorhynchus albirostris]
MADLFLLLLCLHGLPQAAADNIQAIYVALGEAMELPCPSPPTLDGDEFLSWFRSPATGSSTALVAHVQVARPAPDPGKTGRESRLKLLGNNSLWLEGSKEGDAGRYWCAVLGHRHKYQNWRVYDVSVLRGSQFSARAADGSPCSILLCSVVPTRRLDSVTWLEGKGPVRGRVQSFWGDGAALLLVCPGEGLPEPRGRRPRNIRCLMPQNKGVSFSLAASMDAFPALCAPSTEWGAPWILMLLLTVGQGFTIAVLSVMLWRRRVQGTKHRNASFPQFKPEIQVYENIHLAHLRAMAIVEEPWAAGWWRRWAPQVRLATRMSGVIRRSLGSRCGMVAASHRSCSQQWCRGV